MKVPFFNYPNVFQSDKANFNKIFDDVGNSGSFILQKELSDFEAEIASFCGCNYAVGVGNATDAMEMLINVAGIGVGDEVILCSHTMVATASAIHFNGAIPVPVEMGEDHLIDPDSIRKNITPRTKAILPTQLNGRTANMDQLLKIAKDNNLTLIEDSAQALGSMFKGQHAGTFGFGGCISFYPAKLLGCFGDGGMILINDDEVYKKLLLIRDHGRDLQTGDVLLWGRNSRLDNLQAALLKHQLNNYQVTINRRREIANIYHEELRNIDFLKLPPPPEDGDHFDVFQNYEIEATQRDELKEYLTKNNIGTTIQWGGKAVHHFDKLGFDQYLPFTDEMFKRMLMLPMNMSLTDEEVLFVTGIIIDFYKK